ncbi:MAG: PA2169 family four-helix-bundle protein [Rhodoferax sp.]|uniref:ferritin-like domain-containing protein n=1 Tax=Rhodoferax sp. TaxID=50421 RepID=UPI00326756F1
MTSEILLNPGLLAEAPPVGVQATAAELPMHNDDVVSTLNYLIETCYDGEYGFRACIARTNAQNLKSVFEERMRDCASSAAELASEVVRLGGTPEDSGTVGGTVHRGWVAVRDMLTSDSDTDLAVLEECERGEDIALGRYRKALSEALPLEIQGIVARQMRGVQKNHDTIKMLRDGYKQQR